MEKMEKIDVAKILAECPSDMELDCSMFENLYFDYIDDSLDCPYPIICYKKDDNKVKTIEQFSKYGTYTNHPNGKCVIFPKGRKTWAGVVPPFNDGDIVTCGWNDSSESYSWTCIVAEPPCKITDNYLINDYCSLDSNGVFVSGNSAADSATYVRFATEEERQMLFKAIEDNGYKWNAEAKTLEKLVKAGDITEYPKTYEECCMVLGSDPSKIKVLSNRKDIIHEENKHCYEMYNLYQLLICRDAYWKIAGEKMRLKKPWKPDYTIDEYDTVMIKFCIKNFGGEVEKLETAEANTILAFPTAEIRDAFYSNFKDSIERIKELL